MCEIRLIAWLDGELPHQEAILVEQHIRACVECRGLVDAYERVSNALVAYCDAAAAQKTKLETAQLSIATPRKESQPMLHRWVPVLLGAAAAVIVALSLVSPRAHVRRPAAPPETAAGSPLVDSQSVFESTPAPAPAASSHAAPDRTPDQAPDHGTDRVPANSGARSVRKPHAVRPAQTPVQTQRQAPARAPRPSQILDAGWAPASPAIQIAIPAEAMFPPGAVPEGVNFTADFGIAADGSAAPLRFEPRPNSTSGAGIGTPVNYERKTTRP